MIGIVLVTLLVAPQVQSVEAVLERRIGSADGMIEEVFARISDLAADAEGNVYVLDEQADELRVFSAGGAYVRNIGRRGRGPGEFSRPSHVHVRDGVVTVLNPGGRIASFTLAGDPVETATLPFGSLSANRLGAGAYVGHVSHAISRGAAAPLESVALFVGESADTLFSVESSDVLYQSASATSLIRSSICRLAYATPGRGDEIWVVSGLDGSLTQWVRNGTTALAGRSARVAPEGTPVSGAARAELLDLLPPQPDPDGATISVPGTISSVCGLEHAGGESVWVRLQNQGGKERWLSVDVETLRIRRDLMAPEGVALRAFAGSRAYGTWTDASGFRYVGIYRLE